MAPPSLRVFCKVLFSHQIREPLIPPEISRFPVGAYPKPQTSPCSAANRPNAAKPGTENSQILLSPPQARVWLSGDQAKLYKPWSACVVNVRVNLIDPERKS